MRSAIEAALARDVEMRSERTARLLVAAGITGVAGALGITLMLSGHPFDHHPPWHVAICSTIWAGFLVVSLSFVFLGIRTPSHPLARAAAVGVLGVGLAGLCAAVCPDQHCLRWWSSTALGSGIASFSGVPLSVGCFGLATATFIAATVAASAGCYAGVATGVRLRRLNLYSARVSVRD